MGGVQTESSPGRDHRPPGGRRAWLAAGLGVGLAAAGMGLLGLFPWQKRTDRPTPPVAEPSAPAPAPAARYEVLIRKPAGPPVLFTGIKDAHGKPVTMACADCHKARQPNPQARLGTELQFFHPKLHGKHGNLACVACHNPADGYSTLRLADGSAVPYTEVMQLCAQCHGPQHRDYLHGAHGGMAGHWDLARGGRTRNNCVDCHPAHAPAVKPVHPAKGPNDRTPVAPTKEPGHE